MTLDTFFDRGDKCESDPQDGKECGFMKVVGGIITSANAQGKTLESVHQSLLTDEQRPEEIGRISTSGGFRSQQLNILCGICAGIAICTVQKFDTKPLGVHKIKTED